MVQPSRRTQPYRRGERHPSSVLDAILRGRAQQGFNPADWRRELLRRSKVAAVMGRRG